MSSDHVISLRGVKLSYPAPEGDVPVLRGIDVAETMFALVRETGAAMLMVTHDISMAGKCDRTISIDAGLIAA